MRNDSERGQDDIRQGLAVLLFPLATAALTLGILFGAITGLAAWHWTAGAGSLAMLVAVSVMPLAPAPAEGGSRG